MNFVSTRVNKKTGHSSKSKRRQKNTPDPRGSSKLGLNSRDTHLMAFRAFYLYGIRSVASISWDFSILRMVLIIESICLLFTIFDFNFRTFFDCQLIPRLFFRFLSEPTVSIMNTRIGTHYYLYYKCGFENIIVMDIPEERYRKIIATFKPLLSNVISEYPIPLQLELPVTRNLKYIIQKQKYSNNMPFTFYTQFPQEIKQLLNDQIVQNRLLAVRLIRCLPFHYRVKTIQETQNELSMFIMRQAQSNSPDRKPMGKNPLATPQFHYQSVADMIDLLLSVYELSGLSQEIYFDVNQKITSVISHILQKCFSSDRNISRNSYQALRAIFLVFSQCKGRATNKKKDSEIQASQQSVDNLAKMQKNKLINKIINIFSSKDQNYSISTLGNASSLMIGHAITNIINLVLQNPSSNPQLRQLIAKTREYQIRVRCRMLTGISYLLTYIPQYLPELYELLTQQIFVIIQNANQFDINLQCFLSIKALLALPLSHHLRVSIIKKWIQVLSQLSNSYKKEYYPFYIQILKQVCDYEYCPLRIKYFASTNFLQITGSIQQQLSRFIVYKFSCRNIMIITNQSVSGDKKLMKSTSNKKVNPLQGNNIILNIFQYTWFIDRVRQQNDLFRCEFLISLLHAYFTYPNRLALNNKAEIKDLFDLCNLLLDWNCSSKEQTHIPTIKFAFDMYLEFLKEAAFRLGNQMQKYIKELIQRCNGPTMYLLFKFKLIATFVKLEIYSKSIIPYSQTKLKLDFLQGQAAPFMMPRNPKPIFDYDYSLTVDGQIQSRKEIETIKVIMELLTAIQQVYKHHPETVQTVNNMVMQYHQYLSNLQVQKTSNKDLINCLQSLEADHYFTDCQRNFLLALIDQQDSKGNNIEYTLNDKIVFSPFQTFDSDEEYNIFGGMSPVHLKIRLIGGRSYTSVFIEAKKSQWVGLPEMKLVVSSAIEIKQVPFESCVIEIKIDRSGLINFQAWTIEGTPLMLGSGSHRINRKFKWLHVNHLKVIDGIRSKAFLSRPQISGGKQIKMQQDSTYLTYCFGQPVLLQIIYSRNQIVVTVNNKQVLHQVQQLIGGMVQQLMEGTAQIIKP